MSEEKRWDLSLLVVLFPALLFIVLLFIYPFFYGIFLSFTNADGAFTLENFIKFFTDNWELRTIWITLGLAIPATLINVILAIPFAYYMRHGMKGEKLITFFPHYPHYPWDGFDFRRYVNLYGAKRLA